MLGSKTVCLQLTVATVFFFFLRQVQIVDIFDDINGLNPLPPSLSLSECALFNTEHRYYFQKKNRPALFNGATKILASSSTEYKDTRPDLVKVIVFVLASGWHKDWVWAVASPCPHPLSGSTCPRLRFITLIPCLLLLCVGIECGGMATKSKGLCDYVLMAVAALV